MQYGSYQNKIRRIADRLAALYAKRFLILPLVVLFFIGVGVLLAFKGTLISVGKCPEEIVFGESAKYRAIAIVSWPDIQYAPVGTEEWSFDDKLAPGEYKTRVVTWSLSGEPNYSETQTIRVTQRAITPQIKENSVTYGEHPTLSDKGLRKGDRISGTIILSSLSNNGTATYSIDQSSIRIADKNGVDVTKSYTILSPHQKTLTIDARKLKLKIHGVEKEYDGNIINKVSYEISSGSVVEGDYLSVIHTQSYGDVGEYTPSIVAEVYNSSRGDVTPWYNIIIDNATYKITPRELHIKTGSASKVYDGYPLSCETFTLTRNEDISFLINLNQEVFISHSPSLTDCGSIPNDIGFSVSVKKSYFKDTTHNYKIIVDEIGTLTVTPRRLTIETPSETTVFNGHSQSFGGFVFSSGTPIGNHNYIPLDVPELIDAGVYDNTLTLKVYDESSKDVTQNYELTYKYGKITIQKLAMRLKPAETVRYFNGAVQYAEQDIEHPEISAIMNGSFSYQVTVEGQLYYPGQTETKITSFKLLNTDGEDVTKKNLNVSFEPGIMTMTLGALTVVTESTTATYTGQMQSFTNHKLQYPTREHTLASDVKVIAVDPMSFTEVGSYLNQYSVQIFSGNGEDITQYFEIEYEFGKVVISPRPIVIETGSEDIIYNGKAISNSHYEMTSFGTLVLDHMLVLSSVPEFTDVGQYENELIFKILNSSLEDVSHNYSVCYIYGVITIRPIEIRVDTTNYAVLYNGEYQSPQNPTITYKYGFEAVPDQYHDCILPSHLMAGTYENLPEIIFYDQNGRNVTHNYDIEYIVSTFTIMKKPISVISKSMSFTFDGAWHSCPEFEVIANDGVLTNDTFRATSYALARDVGNEANVISLSITSKHGYDVTQSYQITYMFGELTIDPLHIILQPVSIERLYNGRPLYAPQALMPNEKLDALTKNGYTYTFKVDGSRTEVGESFAYVSSFTLYDENKTPLEGYVIPEYRYGLIKVLDNSSLVSLIVLGKSKQYDGKPLTLTENDILVQSLPGAVELVDLKLNLSITEVGSIELDYFKSTIRDHIGYRLIDRRSGEDVTDQYELSIDSFGIDAPVLEITPRILTLLSASETRLYDGNPLENDEVRISLGSLVDGHSLITSVSGRITNIGSCENVIENYRILDAEGNDVTHNYSVTTVNGILTITEE